MAAIKYSPLSTGSGHEKTRMVPRSCSGLLSRVPRNWLYAVAGAFTASVFVLVLTNLLADHPVDRPTFPISQVFEAACHDFDNDYNPHVPQDDIPNIVHYVWLLKDPALFQLNFNVFLSVYSSWLFFGPDKILIHTDATPEVFEAARESDHDWTRRILAIPNVFPEYVTAPNTTSSGVPIKLFEHKADFLRMDALQKYGGIYLDMDVVPLRDIKGLRKSGFANILGGVPSLQTRWAGYLNNGVMMARPGTLLMHLWKIASHRFFDGKWQTASIFLLTDLADRLVSVMQEVLILHPRAFAPVGWDLDDEKHLWMPKLGSPATMGDPPLSTHRQIDESDSNEALTGLQSTCDDTVSRLAHVEATREPGEVDFSSSYVVHAFDGKVPRMSGWDGVVDVDYILKRRSNYARAVYPALRHAIDSGIVPEPETSTAQ